jgi:RHS repeat-associated protein
VIKEQDSDNSVAYNVYGINLISREVDGNKAYYIYNGHGDVTGLLSSSGTIIASYYYDAFGNAVEQSGNFGNPYRYAGYIFDSETELYNLNARFYDAKLARFMQEDTYWNTNNMIYGDNPRYSGNRPVPNAYSIMQSLNLYTYCVSNPIRYIDPTGHVLSETDIKNLTPSQQNAIKQLTKDWETANAAGDKKGMADANAAANAIRASAGYSGGTDGKTVVPTNPGSGIMVRDVDPNVTWNDNRTISYAGGKEPLKEGVDFYIYVDSNNNANAYFFNNVGTILTVAGATLTFNDNRETGGGTTITVTPSLTRPPTSNELINSVLYRGTPLVDGKDYYLGWDDRAHFVGAAFGPVPVAPKPGGPQDSIKGNTDSVKFGSEVNSKVLNTQSIEAVAQIVANAGLTSVMISSTMRTPEQQANAMYHNIVKNGVEHEKGVYGTNGKKVIDAYDAAEREGKSKEDIITDMTNKINELGPSNVSDHCSTYENYSKKNVFDIGKGSVSDKEAFVKALDQAKADGLIDGYLNENTCYHIIITIK